MPCLSSVQIAHLEEPISLEEIKLALFSMKPLKSPGPVGFPPIFYQKKWNIIGEEVCQATKNFLEGGHMLKETNKTFIALIPKVNRLENVGQFRPITLCNNSYKIISKCLVRRLQPLTNSLIGHFQNAFVLGRSINDNCIIAHEMLSKVKKSKKDAYYNGVYIIYYLLSPCEWRAHKAHLS